MSRNVLCFAVAAALLFAALLHGVARASEGHSEDTRVLVERGFHANFAVPDGGSASRLILGLRGLHHRRSRTATPPPELVAVAIDRTEAEPSPPVFHRKRPQRTSHSEEGSIAD
jgi:hypothetical protein